MFFHLFARSTLVYSYNYRNSAAIGCRFSVTRRLRPRKLEITMIPGDQRSTDHTSPSLSITWTHSSNTRGDGECNSKREHGSFRRNLLVQQFRYCSNRRGARSELRTPQELHRHLLPSSTSASGLPSFGGGSPCLSHISARIPLRMHSLYNSNGSWQSCSIDLPVTNSRL